MNELKAFENEVRKRLGLPLAVETEPATLTQNHTLSEIAMSAELSEEYASNLKGIIKKYIKSDVAAFEQGLKEYMRKQKAR